MDCFTILIIGVILTSVQPLDFSQFYLPPCCYIPPQGEHYSGYASSIVSLKHNDTPTFRDIDNEITNTSSSSHNASAVLPSESAKLYKLIIPLENELIQTNITSPNSTALAPITVGKILFPTNENISEHSQFKRNLISNEVQTSNISETQTYIMLDHEIPEQSNSEKRSLYESERKVQIQNTNYTNEFNESSLVVPTNSTPKILQLEQDRSILQTELNSNNKSDINQDPLLEASSEVINTQITGRKMPAIWLKNLRRALYQSLTAEKLNNKQDAPNKIEDEYKAPSHLQSKQIWKTLKNAKLKYIDKLTQSSSELPDAIYLPSGQGPIVSGVVVNSINKGVELRIGSELYLANAGVSESRDDCHCSLIHQGELVMAYWSVSRIFNEYGQPALQYLVYPLPHIVPTPPQLHPFTGNDIQFRPSPVDPLDPNDHPQNQIQPISNYIDDSPNPGPNTPYFHPLPNGHHRIEISNHNHELNSHQGVIPTNPSLIHPAQLSNYRGVLMENEHGYTPEFLDAYQEAILEHFRLKGVLDKSRPPTGGYISGPSGPTGGFPIHSTQPILPTGHPYLQEQPVQEKPIFSTPTQIPPPPAPITGPYSDPNHQYPNSIQDILLPIPVHIAPSPLPPLKPVGIGHPYPPTNPGRYPVTGGHHPPTNPEGYPVTGGHHPPTNPEGYPVTGGHYPPRRAHDGKHPTHDKRPNNNKPPRKDTPTKHPHNKDKYPYPPHYPVFEGEQGLDYYPPPNRYPLEGDRSHHLPPRGQHPPNIPGTHSYLPGFSIPPPQEPYDHRHQFENQNQDLEHTQNGIGSAFNVKDKFYYPESKPKPSIPYTTRRPDEPKKLTHQDIKEEGYILNF